MAIMAQLILTSAIILGGFYFILLRPVLEQQRKTKRDLLELQVGDEIVTTGGLIGKVVDIRQPSDGPIELVLELAPGVTVRALTSAIQERRGPAAELQAQGAETSAEARPSA
ncbi:MAG TPA: preprotein translocase subunit YajC [Dehalococcoidia bacterium]|nr:preprotein translocase subunit YajC [Dehalococcoidia bacterium]